MRFFENRNNTIICVSDIRIQYDRDRRAPPALEFQILLL